MQLQSEMDHISQRSLSKEALETWAEFMPKAFQIAESQRESQHQLFPKRYMHSKNKCVILTH